MCTRHRAAALAALALTSVFTLAGCEGSNIDSVDGDDSPAKSSTASGGERVKADRVTGGEGSDPDQITILCVDGYAFLYVYRDTVYAGGPSLTRFPERDADVCGPKP